MAVSISARSITVKESVLAMVVMSEIAGGGRLDRPSRSLVV